MSASRQNGFGFEQTPARTEPQELGRYLLLERIGGGGMAEIFRGTTFGADNFRRNVVIKRMLPELSRDEGFMKMFVDEANICAQLNHPNIVHVHELGVHEGQYFMVMEEINGVDLGRAMKYLTDHGLGVPPCIVADIGRQLTRGLSYAHAMSVDGTPMRIVHRDITPTNVMIANTGVIKILDFGIARAAEAFRVARTSAGEIKGKCAYLSPEQLAMAPIDHRVDIFAAGVLLHELLLGRRLFKAETPWATIQAVSEMPIPRPTEVDHRIPVALEEIVLKMLARNPAERYQEAGQVADALDAFLVKQQYQSHELLTFAMDICQAVQPPRRSAPVVGTPARIPVKANVSVVQAPEASREPTEGSDGVLSPSQVSMVLEEPSPAESSRRDKGGDTNGDKSSDKSGSPSGKPNERQLNSSRRVSRRSGSSRIVGSSAMPVVTDSDDEFSSAQPFPQDDDGTVDNDQQQDDEAAVEADSPFLPFGPAEDSKGKTYVDPNLEPSMIFAASGGHTARLDLLKSFGPIPSEDELARPAAKGKAGKSKKPTKAEKTGKTSKADRLGKAMAKRKAAKADVEDDGDDVASEKTEDIGPITRIIRNTLARRVLTAAVFAHTLWAAFGPQQTHGVPLAAASNTTTPAGPGAVNPALTPEATTTPQRRVPQALPGQAMPGQAYAPPPGVPGNEAGLGANPPGQEMPGAVASPNDWTGAEPPQGEDRGGANPTRARNGAVPPAMNQLPPLDTAPRAGEYDTDEFAEPTVPPPRKPSLLKKVRHALPVDPFTD